MTLILSDIAIYFLCLLILGLVLFTGCYLIKVVRSNAYHEKRLRKAEENYRKNLQTKQDNIKNFSGQYIEKNNLLARTDQKSAS